MMMNGGAVVTNGEAGNGTDEVTVDNVQALIDELKALAHKALMPGIGLSADETTNQADLMEKLKAFLKGQGVTDAEIASLILKEILSPKRGCGCSTCKAREEGKL